MGRGATRGRWARFTSTGDTLLPGAVDELPDEYEELRRRGSSGRRYDDDGDEVSTGMGDGSPFMPSPRSPTSWSGVSLARRRMSGTGVQARRIPAAAWAMAFSDDGMVDEHLETRQRVEARSNGLYSKTVDE